MIWSDSRPNFWSDFLHDFLAEFCLPIFLHLVDLRKKVFAENELVEGGLKGGEFHAPPARRREGSVSCAQERGVDCKEREEGFTVEERDLNCSLALQKGKRDD